ncbi:hypothetical protein JTE90_019172 [Oedothorax gibbosus]|uniref:Ribosome assembly factor mrt4 n=1 Tax=Oedothorax gibbosus TaxID=931172 RepID=A0AAV6UUH2_9ARAC|nr:hypothetical protein JTE90_019172 [Oedothorax gibbosus]
MPKSKRNKQVELSKTKKHGLEGKKHLYEEIRSCVDNYAKLFVFSVTDMRNSKMKAVRDQWKQSRFFIGKNKVMAMALGRTPEEEYRTNLYKISQQLKGERGLLFSNKSTEEVLNWFNSYSEGDFARSGNIASENVSLKEGALPQFAHSLESYLRQLGLPTTLKRGVVHLLQDYDVCKVGDVLTPDMARILKLLGYEMAEFQVKIECVWSQDGTFLDLKSDSKENRVIAANESAMKAGFQISEDLANLDDNEEMEVMDSEVKNQEQETTQSSSPIKKPTIDTEETTSEKELGNNEDVEETIEEKIEDEEEEQIEDEEEEQIEDEEEEDEEPSDDENESTTKETDQADEDNNKSEKIKDLLNLTKEKIKEVEVTPPRISPKMTRSRARASAIKKVLTPEERMTRTRSAKKALKKK